MPSMIDGTKCVRLRRPWFHHASGEIVKVTDEQYEWLTSNAYAVPAEQAEPEQTITEKRKRKRRPAATRKGR